MKDYNPDASASAASWALRYAASQKGVFHVLSGMNSMEQVKQMVDLILNSDHR